jgi:phage gp45-like
MFRKSFILLLSAICFISSVSLFAEDVNPVRQIKADVKGTKIDGSYVASGMVAWFYPEHEFAVDSYNVYVADGKVGDDGEFTLLKSLPRDTTGKNKGSYILQFQDLKGVKGGWTFTVTAVRNGIESEKEVFFYAEMHNSQPTNKIYIVSKPALHTKLGSIYNYIPKFETNIENPVVKYSLLKSPEGAEIDEETGEITWTSDKSGVYIFAIQLKVISGDKVIASTIQDWQVKVTECEEMAVIKGIIKDEAGNLIKIGNVEIFSNNSNDGKFGKDFYANVKIENGEFTINGVDKGQYYILVNAFSNSKNSHYYPVWYDNALNFDDAKPLEVDCGDAKEISFTVKEIPEPKFYVVSGKVVDAETNEPIKNALVEFNGISGITGRFERFTFKTNSNGVYEGKLRDEFDYKAVASCLTPKHKNNSDSTYGLYFPQYYELAENPSDAKVLKLTENLTGIDFALNAVPDYSNSLSGKVANVDGEPVVGAEVVAYLVNTDNSKTRYLYYGKVIKSDDFGTFKIENLIPGEYVIFAHSGDKLLAPGFYVESAKATLSWEDATRVTVDETGNSGDYTITLPIMEKSNGKGKVRGGVGKHKKGIVNSNGVTSVENALNGASVYIVNSKNNVIQNINTDVNGQYELGNIAAGKYTLVIDKIGYSSSRSDITLSDDVVVERDFELSPSSPTSVDDNSDLMNVEVYPNPAVDMIKISFNSLQSGSTVTLMNYAGVELQSTNVENSQKYLILNTNNLATGAYFIKVKSGNTVTIKSVAVVK